MYLNKVENKEFIMEVVQFMFNYCIVDNVLEIGCQFVMICELDNDCICVNLDKLVFFYGFGDFWVLQNYYEVMKERFLDGDIKLLWDKDIRYVFVLDMLEKVVKMVWEWIEEYLRDLEEVESIC